MGETVKGVAITPEMLADLLRQSIEISNQSITLSTRAIAGQEHLTREVSKLNETMQGLEEKLEKITLDRAVQEGREIERLTKTAPTFLDVFKSPVVVLGLATLFAIIIMFAIARDASTAQRVVDKVPTRESAK
jgi:hypothetical protein